MRHRLKRFGSVRADHSAARASSALRARSMTTARGCRMGPSVSSSRRTCSSNSRPFLATSRWHGANWGKGANARNKASWAGRSKAMPLNGALTLKVFDELPFGLPRLQFLEIQPTRRFVEGGLGGTQRALHRDELVAVQDRPEERKGRVAQRHDRHQSQEQIQQTLHRYGKEALWVLGRMATSGPTRVWLCCSRHAASQSARPMPGAGH